MSACNSKKGKQYDVLVRLERSADFYFCCGCFAVDQFFEL